ncbi:MAG: hypothetical protein M1827_003809 [Pycnora praestabilis]|nr:MAG: hypothetical protein M1827_003809 [Pycnora praestabilis]
MPTPTRQAPPQTLRQAKKAYKKSTTVISETERRQIERNAVLKERADSIAKRERQKKTNQQKRESKETKDRETRRKMGIPEPGLVNLSPRQVRMSQFFGRGPRSKQTGDDKDLEEDDSTDSNIIQEGHVIVRGLLQEQSDAVRNCQYRQSAATCKEGPAQQQKQSCNENIIQADRILLRERSDDCSHTSSSIRHKKSETVTSPPLLPPPVIVRINASWDEQPEPEDNWDDFLASNTQIARELSVDTKLGNTKKLSSRTPDFVLHPQLIDGELNGAMSQGLEKSADYTEKHLRAMNSPSVQADLLLMKEENSALTTIILSEVIHDPVRKTKAPDHTVRENVVSSKSFDEFQDSETEDLLQAMETPTGVANVQNVNHTVREVSPSQKIINSICTPTLEDFEWSSQELRGLVP